MVKVKVMQEYYLKDIEQELNKFIKNKKLIDVKYSIHNGLFNALIIYDKAN